MMVRRLLPGALIRRADAADALAVAICHAHHRASRAALGGRGADGVIAKLTGRVEADRGRALRGRRERRRLSGAGLHPHAGGAAGRAARRPC